MRGSGLVYLVLDFVGNSVIASLPGAPTSGDPILAPFLARHETTIGLMALLIALGAVFLAAFAVALRRCLDDSPTSDLVAAFGVMAATILAAASGVMVAAPGDRPEDQARVFWDLWNAGLVAIFPAAGLVAAVSLLARRDRGKPAWIWRTGFPLAVVCLVPYIGFVSFKLFPIWIAALSVSLLRGRHWEFAPRR